MSTEMRGRVKESLWNRPVCSDNSEAYRVRQEVRRNFKDDCKGECFFEVASPDLIGEALELGQSIETYPDFPE